MRIQHNISAMNSYRNYNNNSSALSKNLEKLSSGYRINRAGDDAAGLAISEKMRAQIAGLDQAQANVKDGISLVKTAEGALQEVQDMLNRMVTLATQSANGTYDSKVDRAALQDEMNALTKEIDRIADSSNFNGTKLLDGSLGTTYTSAVADIMTQPTATAVAATTAGSTTAEAVYTLNVAGAKFAEDGTVDVTVFGKTYSVDVTKNMTADKFAEALVTAMNADKITDADAGAFTAAVTTGQTAITLTAANKAAVKDTNNIKAGNFTAKGSNYVQRTAGTPNDGLTLQIGDTSESFNKLTVAVDDMGSASLGVSVVSVDTQDNAAFAVKAIKDAINTVSSQRGKLGAIQNRLEHTQNNLSVMEENIQDAESTIRDTDIADEMTAYTKNNILLQSAQAMLAQANQMPQGVLQLLQ